MNGGIVTAGLVLVGLTLFAAVLLAPAADAWQTWLGLGIATGVGGTLVGTGVVSR